VLGTRIGKYPVCIGIDVHKKYSYVAIVDESTCLAKNGKIDYPNPFTKKGIS